LAAARQSNKRLVMMLGSTIVVARTSTGRAKG
jgi:hypothetical protein